MDQSVPAEGIDSTAASAVATIPESSEAPNEALGNDTASVATAEKPSTSTSQKPDLASLLSDPDYRRELFKYPDIQKEIEHRASSEAGRRAQQHFDRLMQQQTQQAAQEAERQRILAMDEYDIGLEQKQRLTQQLDAQERERQLQPYKQQMETEYLKQTAGQVFDAVFSLAHEAGAAPEELAKLDPTQYLSLGDYIKGSIKFLASKEGKKLSKEMAKIEGEAIAEERLHEGRIKASGPTVLPAAGGAQSDADFLAAYAAGTTNDHKRAMQVLGR